MSPTAGHDLTNLNSAPKYRAADLHLRPFNPFGPKSDQHQFSPNIVCMSI